jgi:hypothetical protein
MINLVTQEVLKVAKTKAERMPLGTISRLKVNDVILDVMISPSSSGIYFYFVPGTSIDGKELICFKYYSQLL